MFFKKNRATTNAPSPTPSEASLSVSLEKKISLAKEEVHKISLVKPALTNLTSRVGLVLDYSGSMSDLYEDGTVQELIEKILPMAMEFDDNGTMESWIFERGYHRLPDITLHNVEGYIDRVVLSKYKMGQTCYAPVIKDVINRYTHDEPSKCPSYVLFVTDGENSDHGDTTAIIQKCSRFPIFWQFIGIGDERFDYLSRLDDMDGRYVDNADFFRVGRIEDIQYKDILDEYPEWLTNPKVVEMLK